MENADRGLLGFPRPQFAFTFAALTTAPQRASQPQDEEGADRTRLALQNSGDGL